ncbi:MAG: glycosyltransferase family 2 protein [Candidatus Doudnabacteria bacterium]|nr:glycosyltransferase family 2 protein [Candidatus Doudnabacteria bacterium]
MDLSVVIVNYNTKDLLKKCLKSVFASHTSFSFEVLVSDNGSKDGSVLMIKEEFPEVKLIENNANLGFSKGNNVALRQAQGKYCLLLNSDTEIRQNTLEVSIKYMNLHQDVGAMGCRVLLPNGELDKACRRKFPNPANAFLRLFGLKKFSDYNINTPIDQEVEVDAVMGAFMLVRKSVIDRIGLLDEEYFMYGEDLDWCWRIKEAGYKIVYYPQAEITHFKYGSSQLIPFRTIRLAHDAMKIFYHRHYAKENNWFFNQLVYLGINLRMFLVLALNLFRNKKTVH